MLNYLHTMLQRLPRKMAIDESGTCPNHIQPKPQKQILRTIRAIDRNKLILPHTKLLHQPIPNPADLIVELGVCPLSAVGREYEKDVIANLWIIDMIFKDMGDEEAVLEGLFGNVLEGVGWGAAAGSLGDV
jgi:hypothetical protein